MGVAALREVSRRFGGRIAVHGVSIAVAAREIVGIIGPNGAGKTTLLRMLAGVLRPSAGTIELPPAHAIAYFAGERTLPSEVSAARWLSVCAPTAAVTTTRRFGVLSRGTRQRIGLEGAIANTDATLIVLDEPWEGLDIDASRWLSDRLCERRATGACVVVSSHRIHELAAVCDRCLFITAGRTLGSVAPAADLPHDARVSMLVTAFDKLRDHWRDHSASNAEAIL